MPQRSPNNLKNSPRDFQTVSFCAFCIVAKSGFSVLRRFENVWCLHVGLIKIVVVCCVGLNMCVCVCFVICGLLQKNACETKT